MSEQTFRSPGFFEQEIELTAPGTQPTGVPGGLIGAAESGPAFVPTTVSSFSDFEARFGGLDPDRPATYAANEWLKHKGALTFIRVLGAGANASAGDISATVAQGVVRNAGFKLTGQAVSLPNDGTSDYATASISIDDVTLLAYGEQITLTDALGVVLRITLVSTGTPGTAVTTNGAGTVASPHLASVSIAGGAYAFTVRDDIISAVNSTFSPNFAVTATSGGDFIVNLQQDIPGVAGNTTITETVANAGAATISAAFTGGDEAAFDGRKTNTVQFLVARHKLPSDTSVPSEWKGFPVFSDNPSFSPPSADTLNIVRGVLMFPTGARGMVLDMTGTFSQWSGTGALIDDLASTDLTSTSATYKKFKFAVSSSQGTNFGSTDGYAGVRILTASFDPNATDYFGKVLNTDPKKFQDEQHLLYLDFPVEDELVPLDTSGDKCIAIASGSSSTYLSNFGRFDTRYTTARTPAIISQPFGNLEHDLFHFETITDGASGNALFKISIGNVKASIDPKNQYGTFDVFVRDLYDSDISPTVLESYTGCDLNPDSPNFVARKIGDRKVTFNFDATDEAEQRLLISGKYPNASRRVRIIISSTLDSGVVPKTALPFGFRGIPVVRTTQTLTDTSAALTEGGRTYGAGLNALPRLTCLSSGPTGLTGSIIPPLPYRFKITKGEIDGSAYVGSPGILEIPDSRLYWGVKFEKLIPSGTASGKIEDSVMNANDGTEFNPLVLSYSRFQGIQKLDTLVTGADADVFNANKFTLARVALSNQSISDVTGTVEAHMKETAYIRNGVPSTTDYRITDSALNRLTFASLLSGSASTFNKFSEYAKFSTIFYGGFDGVNILDGAASKLGDRATSAETGGLAQSTAAGLARSGLGYDPNGEKLSNNAVNSYRTAAKLMTDKLTVNVNVIAAPGIREPLVTDYIVRRLSSYAFGMYTIDIPGYTDSDVRIFEDSSGLRPNVTKTANSLFARNLNSNYTAAYFPEVFVNDTISGRRVKVPASVAALGALAYGDKVSYPWYAPAGFNRAALDFVGNVEVRLSTSDRDYLYENLINPIATFPGNGFVIFGQKTLQLAKSAFDRVNVRRLFLELKRVVNNVARGLLFEPNDATTRRAFVDRTTPLLNLIKAQAGIEQFRIVCDETNNTQADVEASRINGRIVVIPTRAVEFIAVDFIITPAGVEFV